MLSLHAICQGKTDGRQHSAFPRLTGPTKNCWPTLRSMPSTIHLPNQMHVPWTVKAAEAGKHVLCEKPISLTVAEAKTLLEVRKRTGVKIGEAFMIRSYTQWLRVGELLRAGPHRQAALGRRILQLFQ